MRINLFVKVGADRATPFSFSTNALHITQAIEGVEKLALRRVGASIIASV
jgi:hypothetical protein